MAKLTHGVVHATDTPYGRDITPDDIYAWHLGKRINENGTITFLGKTYKPREFNKKFRNQKLVLFSGKEIPVLDTNGRGWSIVGYADMILRSGEIINLIPYNFDDVIDPWEITNGAKGFNSCGRHIVLAGGGSIDGVKEGIFEPEKVYNAEQLETLNKWIGMQKEMIKEIKIVGHNEISAKTCPNFDVQKYLKKHSL